MDDEELDIVDRHDGVIGRYKRSEAHRLGLRHRGVHIFLFTPDGQLLIQKRAKGTRSSPGTLDCSVSEHVRAGESYAQAAQRGLKEELGLEEIDLNHVLKFAMVYGANDFMISHLYEGKVNPAKVCMDVEEVDNVAYYTLSDLLQMLTEGHTQFSRWFRELLLWYCSEESDVEVYFTSDQSCWLGSSN
jgi:isopentenyl-diphosphate delta-isomerase